MNAIAAVVIVRDNVFQIMANLAKRNSAVPDLC
jgi:hypothetical protein